MARNTSRAVALYLVAGTIAFIAGLVAGYLVKATR